MALMRCPDCGKRISKRAFTCPSCGAPVAADQKKSRRGGCGCLVMIILISFLGAIIGNMAEDPPRGPAVQNAPVRHAPARRTSAEILKTRVVPHRNPDVTAPMQMAITTWKNTGETPIRAVDVIFTFRNRKGAVLKSTPYTLYAEFDNQPGVAPGETYTTPSGEGFVYFPGIGERAATVDVTITEVLEFSGMR